jgi:hypothetical protein
MSSVYHVTRKDHAAAILTDGFEGGWGDAGFGVYLYDGLFAAEEYLERGGWDGEANPDDLCILELEVPTDDADYVQPEPDWPNPEDYSAILYHEMTPDTDEKWRPERKLLVADAPQEKAKPMRLDAFISSGVKHEPSTAAEIIGIEEGDFAAGSSAWIYDGAAHLFENANGTFCCTIYSDSREFDDRNKAAAWLYADFYISECADDPLAETLREDDGTLDAVVGDLLQAMPEIDPDGDDWGGIMGLVFSDTSKEAWSINEVYNLMKDAAKTYAPSGSPEP